MYMLCSIASMQTRQSTFLGHQLQQSSTDAAVAPQASYHASCPGIHLMDLTPGVGSAVRAQEDVVRLRVCESTVLSNGRPLAVADGNDFSFEMGSGGRMAVWEAAAIGMRPGGRRRVLVCPSASIQPFKRGVEAKRMIPDGETGRFEIELLEIESGWRARMVRFGVQDWALRDGLIGGLIGVLVLPWLLLGDGFC